ncbi:hypothetical protein EOD08_01025 [Mesorhizobium sp. M6A.T.Ca.TU.002.02.2.1]|nr:hypothetical protein EOD08_01025 [Mesorhizobium sp. M6A.T.Ca.TU.002.02.2.1]
MFHALYRAVECWEREVATDRPCQTVRLLPSLWTDWKPSSHSKAGRSWAGARPEARAIGYDAHGVAAHIVILHLRHTPAGPDPAL